jgi:hypothetical protein
VSAAQFRPRRLTTTQIKRLQQLQRPNYVCPPLGDQDRTDRSLADRGLVAFRGVHARPGYFVTVITNAGREAVGPDEYEYCGCGSLTPIEEAACLGCGSTKDWAQPVEADGGDQ